MTCPRDGSLSGTRPKAAEGLHAPLALGLSFAGGDYGKGLPGQSREGLSLCRQQCDPHRLAVGEKSLQRVRAQDDQSAGAGDVRQDIHD